MPRGARTVADLDRAIRTLQRRARDDRSRIASLERRADLDEDRLREHEHKLSPAPSTNSTPALPSGGSDLAGTARSRARLFFKRLIARIAG